MLKPEPTLAARIAKLGDLQECAIKLDGYSEKVLEFFPEPCG